MSEAGNGVSSSIITDDSTMAGDGYVLRLYVTGTSPRSMQAIVNIQSVCSKYIQGEVDLQVIDIYQQPEQARLAQIIAAPTLIKLSPAPLQRMVGDLSDELKVLYALGIEPPIA